MQFKLILTVICTLISPFVSLFSMQKQLTERIMLNVPKEEYDMIESVSDTLGISKSALIRSIVMSKLNRNSGSEVKISSTALSKSIKLVGLKSLAKVG
jgi:hypothetical protein